LLHGLTILSISSAVLLTAPATQAPARSTLSGLGAHFVCPEALPNDDARQRALHDFLGAYEQAYPSATRREAIVYRHVLLKTHDCKEMPPPRVTVFTGSNGAPFAFTR
jgi:hypothetical protein